MYEMYVVNNMVKKQKLETSDTTIGIKLQVKKQDKNRYNKVYFDKKLFDVGDIVYVISEQEHQELTVHQKNNNVQYWKNKLANKDKEIISLNAKVSELEQSLEQTNEDNKSIDSYKQELQTKYEIIDNLTTSKNNYKTKYEDLQETTTATINQLKARIDALGKELDNSVNASELEDLQEKLKQSEKDAKYWQDSFGTLSEENLGFVNENDELKEKNIAINETNKLLNENILGLTSSFESTKEQITADAQNKQNELKETIEKQQSHIDELTQKYESLLVLKEHIPVKQHYKEIQELQSKLNNAEKELESTKASMETKLATQKSELNIKHANELNDIKSNYADEKANLFVTYNSNLNNLKHEKNNIAKQYNSLLEDVGTITKMNAVFGNKHKHILENKTPMELEDIVSEQLPSADEIIEYVPKNKKQE